MSLLATLERSAADEKKPLFERYFHLVQADYGDPGTVAELKAIMERLGKTPADADNDRRIVQTYNTLREKMMRGVGADEREKPLSERAAKHREQMEATIAKLKRHQRELEDAANAEGAAYMQAQSAVHEIATMMQRTPELFAHLPAPTLGNLNTVA